MAARFSTNLYTSRRATPDEVIVIADQVLKGLGTPSPLWRARQAIERAIRLEGYGDQTFADVIEEFRRRGFTVLSSPRSEPSVLEALGTKTWDHPTVVRA